MRKQIAFLAFLAMLMTACGPRDKSGRYNTAGQPTPSGPFNGPIPEPTTAPDPGKINFFFSGEGTAGTAVILTAKILTGGVQPTAGVRYRAVFTVNTPNEGRKEHFGIVGASSTPYVNGPVPITNSPNLTVRLERVTLNGSVITVEQLLLADTAMEIRTDRRGYTLSVDP